MRTDLGHLSLDLPLLVLSLSLERTGCLVMTPRSGVSAVRTTALPINNSMHRRHCGLAASCWAEESSSLSYRLENCNFRKNLSSRDISICTTAMLLPSLSPPLRSGGRLRGLAIIPSRYRSTSAAPMRPSALNQRNTKRYMPIQMPSILQSAHLRPLTRVGDYRSYSTRLTSTAASTPPPADHQHQTVTATGNNDTNSNRDRAITSQEDTIFALSTANAGPAGVAVVRVSGPRSARVLEALTRSGGATHTSLITDEKGRGEGGIRRGNGGETGPPLPAPRRAVVRRLYDPLTGEVLDEALVLWMPGPRSFTGEDTVELHTHGSRAVINGVLDALGSLHGWGVRMAERGEFTQRAYGNGRMDLTGVEGLADLIAADTAAQRKQALRQMGGALRDKYEAWRDTLKECLAYAEAVIDFGDDEEDVGGDAAFFDSVVPRAAALARDMEAHLKDGGRGEIVRSGLRAAIVGPPNAGKSSLLNLLAARPAAIVSPVAGTTRDVVEVQLDIAGLPVTLSDTAGLRDATADEIEREGMRRALTTVENAHLAIFVADGSDPGASVTLLRRLKENATVKAAESDEGGAAGEDLGGFAGTAAVLDDVIVVLNKADLLDSQTRGHEEEGSSLVALVEEALSKRGEGKGNVWKLSCETREGLEEFVGHLEAVIGARFQGAADDESPLITRRRHRQHVEACLGALRAAQDSMLPLDLAAEEFRIASAELGRITGAVDVEELLDVIFRDFCIGK